MYYRTLEVKPSATAAEIRASYRRLALATHPDKNGGAETRFLAVQKAYEVLIDATQRADYDAARLQAREKLRGFVRPPPLPTVYKPVTYKLADDMHYTFETAPHVVQCGVEYGDIISFNDVLGCFVGLAGDGWLYWCRSGQSHASRLCQRGSSFALSAVTVLQRACLGIGRPSRLPRYAGGRVRGVAGGTTAGSRAAASHDGMTTAERMKQELRRREKVRLLGEYLDETVTEETEERQALIAAMKADYEDMMVYFVQTTRTLLQEADILARDVTAKELKDGTQLASQEGSTRLPSRCPTASSSPSPPAEVPVGGRAMSDCRISPAEVIRMTVSNTPHAASAADWQTDRVIVASAPRTPTASHTEVVSRAVLPQSEANVAPHDALAFIEQDDTAVRTDSEGNEEENADCFCIYENHGATLHGARTEEELPSLDSLHDEFYSSPVDRDDKAKAGAQTEAGGSSGTPHLQILLPACLPPIHPQPYPRRSATTSESDDKVDKASAPTIGARQAAPLETKEYASALTEEQEDALDVSVSTSSSMGDPRAEGDAESPLPQAAASHVGSSGAVDAPMLHPATTADVALRSDACAASAHSPPCQSSRRGDAGRTKASLSHTARSSTSCIRAAGNHATPRPRTARRTAKPSAPLAALEPQPPPQQMTESERREAARVTRATWGRQSADELFAEELAFMKRFARTQYKVGR